MCDNRKHDWFQKDLPAYLFPSPVDQDTSVIEPEAVFEVCVVDGCNMIFYEGSNERAVHELRESLRALRDFVVIHLY